MITQRMFNGFARRIADPDVELTTNFPDLRFTIEDISMAFVGSRLAEFRTGGP
jgi:hypothetical protein